ncbi:unnamed protein product, partial [Leptidea sinapis]
MRVTRRLLSVSADNMQVSFEYKNPRALSIPAVMPKQAHVCESGDAAVALEDVNNGGDSDDSGVKGEEPQGGGGSGDAGSAMEAVLAQLGPFGVYQRYVLFMLLLPNLLSPMYSLNYVFTADRVEFRCLVPECEGAVHESQFENQTVRDLLPADSCRRYRPLQPEHNSCQREHFHPNETLPCDQFLYENQDTIFAEFDLACQEWKRTLVGTVRNAALPLALLLTGYISDGWGRRTAFCIFSGFAGALGLLKSFTPNYELYVTVEFFEAALGYVVELARPSLRAPFACATGVAYGMGGVLFAWIASRLQTWRALLRAVHTPALLLPLYWLLLDESARWLQVTGRTQRAAAVIIKAASWNKSANESGGDDRGGWLSVLRSRVLMLRLATCSFCWVAAAFVYYGLTINSVALSGNKYTNFALNMAMEIVASLLIMMALERIGRRLSIGTAFLLCGVTSISPFYLSDPDALNGMYFAGKLAVTLAFNSLYVFTAEMFPTSARSSALAAASLVGRLGSILAPQTPLLSTTVQAILYGVVSLFAAAAVALVPETRRSPLPQNASGAAQMGAARVAKRRTTTAPTPPPAPALTRITPRRQPHVASATPATPVDSAQATITHWIQKESEVREQTTIEMRELINNTIEG